MSHVDEVGTEWETRKISLWGAAKSFVSQLSVGQDLTKVSMPAIFLNPYSILELGGSKTLAFSSLLLEANHKKDPLERMTAVLRWYLSWTRKERFERKPYNPLLGEIHSCWVTGKEEDGETFFFAEQVSHHPPVSGIWLENKQNNCTMLGNITFGIKFQGIYKMDEENTLVHPFEGECGGRFSFVDKNETLIDFADLKVVIPYYIPFDKIDPRSSLIIWKNVSEAIVKNDMYNADILKVQIEDQQRKRRNENNNWASRYFSYNSQLDRWVWDDTKNKDLTKELYSAHFPFLLNSSEKKVEVDSKEAVPKLETQLKNLEIHS